MHTPSEIASDEAMRAEYTWLVEGDEYHYRGGDVSEGTWQQQCIYELEVNLLR